MIEPTVKILSNFLPLDILNECQEFAISTLYDKRSNFRSSYGWDGELRRNSSPVLIFELATYNKELFSKIRKVVQTKTGKTVQDILIQFWSKNSFLDWHTDSAYSDALTIYVNKEWKPEWGGYFLYGPQSNFSGIIPKENLAVLQPSGIPHCVTPITSDTQTRISLQMFITNNKQVL